MSNFVNFWAWKHFDSTKIKHLPIEGVLPSRDMFNCRKLAPAHWTKNDVSFYKKLIREPPNSSVPLEYSRQPNSCPVADPRDRNKLPRLQRVSFDAVYPSTGVGWCAPQPPNTLLLEGVTGVKSEASLLALLEEILQDSRLQISRIELVHEFQLASVQFRCGFAAWETMRKLHKIGRFKRVIPDEDGLQFGHQIIHQQQRRLSDRHLASHHPKRVKEESNNSNNNNNVESYKRPRSRERTCNPFVPCITVPFEDFERLGFSRQIDPRDVIASIFSGRIASFAGVEEGATSWHIHFGREIDVINADRLLGEEDFTVEGRVFHFRRWKLVKDGQPWKIPKRPVVAEPLPSPSVAEEKLLPLFPSPLAVKEDFVDAAVDVDVDMKDVLSALPRFVKRRSAEPERDIAPEPPVAMAVSHKQVPVAVVEGAEAEGEKAKEIEKEKEAEKEEKPDGLILKHCISSISNASSESVTDDASQNNNNNTTRRAKLAKMPRGRRKKEPKPKSKPGTETEAQIDVGEEGPAFEESLASGCARTEGFFLLPANVKKRVKFPGILEALSASTSSSSSFSSSSTLTGGESGRSSRAQNRRPLLNNAPPSVLDLFKVSPLQSTQKLVSLRNSSIHSFGLVILESAEPGDLIIEYVGELVRASVANIREWHYERQYRGDGIASSYLFRLDNVMVIDATRMGGLARFINHSCDPNCVAKTIALNGSKRIVMYAKKHLRPGDELTYDYKFPLEKDPKKRVKCLCGSSICRKFLN